MVFWLTYSDVLLIVVGTVVLLGPKDLPIVARAAGRITGRAVGYLQTFRGQVDTILQQSQSNNLQKELRETMSQLDAIRHELRSGLSIMQPRPFVRETLQNDEPTLHQATKLVHKIENTLDRFTDTTNANSIANAESTHKASVVLQQQATSFARFAGHLNSHGAKQTINHDCKALKEHEREFAVVPISAVSMGLFPGRNGPIKGGSDLMLESIAERKVAHQALEFLQAPEEVPSEPSQSSAVPNTSA